MTVHEKVNRPALSEHKSATPPRSVMPVVTLIRPHQGWLSLNLGELWAYRELLYFLIWRDLKVRYKQTVFGAAWAVIQPFFTMVVFSIFFGLLAHIPSEGAPYPIFAYSALVPWTFFANAVAQAGTSLVDQERMITKVYFPRLIIPLAATLGGLVDLAIAFGVLLVMMLFYGVVPGWAVWTIPCFILLAAATALGVGLWLSALNVQYRDVRYAIPFMIQFWLFATPVAYPSSLLPQAWRPLYGLNPMAGVVEGFRWALLAKAEAPGPLLVVSVLTALALLISGLFYFRRVEKTFSDVV